MKKIKSVLSGLGMFLVILLSVAAWIVLPWQLLLGLVVLLALWMGLTRIGRQAAAVTWVGVSTLRQRLGASSVIIVGIAGVVGVLVALLAMGDGLQKTLKSTGDTETVIVMRGGAANELSSGVSRDDATLIAQAAGILRDAEGKPITSSELVVVANLPKKSTGTDANVEIRGVGPQAWPLRPNVKIIEGRKFTPGLREMIVGKGARQQFAGLDPGSTINLNNQQWTIVGVFESGDAHESELEGDVDTVSAAYRRGGYQSVTVRLTSPEAFDALKAALASDPRLKVEAKTTLDYYTAQSEGLSKVIRVVGITIATIMAIGAIFGALNSMYAAVATRAREIATLRAIGFRSPPVIVSVMLETMLLALFGGLLGAFIAWLLFNNYTVSTLGANFSQVVFQFSVSPALLWTGVKWALAIGFVGGLLPAIRAARLPVTTALRES
ncbi:MAG TPA: ABC transporter permease [Dokdonella sp.]|uniref:ABC transporter permease n=1 Tax=Dokdonella sp. TaxID=2291710 RepID=UPI002C82CE36|nr:ABC transporter permease [Dokdonella sp.]HOX70919.1 ABC transporter permease [Dokdonella sp.]HPG93999.1 ABC transporter permease [Dokdonella sp.]